MKMTAVAQKDDVARFKSVAVIGGGSFGIALAMICARAGCQTLLWGRNTRKTEQALQDLGESHSNLILTGNRRTAVEGADVVVLAVPSQAVRSECARLRSFVGPLVPIISSAKGIESGTALLMSEVIAEELPNQTFGVVSGPTFAQDLLHGDPAALIVASPTERIGTAVGSPAERFSRTVSSDVFRALVLRDVVGVEIGGAMKNVIALGCGLCRAAGFGESTLATVATRGLNEAGELAAAAGGRRETMTGLSGLGDILLSCSSEQSRNFRFGAHWLNRTTNKAMHGGDEILVEGIRTVGSALAFAKRYGCTLPTASFVREVLFEGSCINRSLNDYWKRLA